MCKVLLHHCLNQGIWGEPLSTSKIATVNEDYFYNEIVQNCIETEAALQILTGNKGITYYVPPKLVQAFKAGSHITNMTYLFLTHTQTHDTTL